MVERLAEDERVVGSTPTLWHCALVGLYFGCNHVQSPDTSCRGVRCRVSGLQVQSTLCGETPSFTTYLAERAKGGLMNEMSMV